MKKDRHFISKYLAGELDSVQTGRFEGALLSDSALQREMNLYKEVDQSLTDSDVLDLRAQLNAMHEPVLQELTQGSRKTNKRVVRYAAVAASIAVLLGIGFLSMLQNPGSITRKFYSPYAMTLVTRSADINVDQLLVEAMIRYDNQQYRDAVILFEKVLASDPEMVSTNLFAGISYIEIMEYKHAEKSLNKVINHRDNLYIEQAEWYIGFCYLMTERREKAIRHFTGIANDNGFYSDKAKHILKKLK